MRSVANLTYTERTLAAAEAVEVALKADFKKAEAEAVTRIPFEYGGQTYNIRSRAERMAVVAAIQDDYYREHGEFNQRALDGWYAKGCSGQRPSPAPVNAALLDRLASVVLYEELTDDDRMKARNTEYPFFSDYQLERRRANEVPEKVAEEYGSDGRNYRTPVRRKRSKRENTAVDKYAKIRNRERAARYRREITPSRETTYNLRETELSAEFVSCAGIATKWREMAASGREEIEPADEEITMSAA